jgi:hypothetical protein
VVERLRGQGAGTILVDDLDQTGDADAAALLPLLQDDRHRSILVVLGAGPGILGADGRLGALGWSVDARLAIPPWPSRGIDAAQIITGLVSDALPGIRWTDAARRALVKRTWSGWPEITAWARALVRLDPVVIDAGAVVAVATGLDPEDGSQ